MTELTEEAGSEKAASVHEAAGGSELGEEDRASKASGAPEGGEGGDGDATEQEGTEVEQPSEGAAALAAELDKIKVAMPTMKM